MTYGEDVEQLSQEELKRLCVDGERLSDEDARTVTILLALEYLSGRVTPTPIASIHAALLRARAEVLAYVPRKPVERPEPPPQEHKSGVGSIFKG